MKRSIDFAGLIFHRRADGFVLIERDGPADALSVLLTARQWAEVVAALGDTQEDESDE